MRYFISILVLVVLSSTTLAQTTTPKFSNEFLNLGVGARALGMGNTQVAIAEDATAGYWNPAGLLNIENKYDIALMHSEYLAGIAQYDYVGFATPIDSLSHLGVSVLRFGVDDIPDTRFLYDADGRVNYDNIQFFGAADYALLLSYARRLSWIPGLQVGANAKVIYRNVGDFANAWGFGLDVGFKLKRNTWDFGLMFRDVTGTFNAWTHNTVLVADIFAQTGNEIPENSVEITLPKMLFGIAKSFRLGKKVSLLTSVDLNTSFDGQRNVLVKSEVVSIDPSFGLELDYTRLVFLRFGINNIQEIKDFDGSTSLDFQPSFGVGVRLKQFTIDYALTDVGDQAESLYSNVFSIKASF